MRPNSSTQYASGAFPAQDCSGGVARSEPVVNMARSRSKRIVEVRKIRVSLGMIVAALFVVAGACGGDGSSSASSEQDSERTGVSFDEAGDGVVASSKLDPPTGEDYGSYARPIAWGDIRSGLRAGNAVNVAFSNTDVCARLNRASMQNVPYKGITSYVREVYYQPEWGAKPVLGVLACSDVPSSTIWPYTTGPGDSGVSAACPSWAPSATRGTGVAYIPLSPSLWMTQVEGSYGTGGDGLWNMKFFNWSFTEEITPSIWLICS